METKKTNEFDRKAFLKTVLINFLNKLGKDSTNTRINAYNGYVTLISNDKSPNHVIQNQEKLKILENCWKLLNDPDFQRQLEEAKEEFHPSPEALSRAVAKTFLEKLLGDEKRKYNMSRLFSKDLIDPSSMSYNSIAPQKRASIELPDGHGGTISITHTGTLSYVPLIVRESIDEYSIEKTLSDSSVQQYTVYSHIDLNRLKEDSFTEYRQIVVDELLSQNNIELSNAGGYVGKVIDTPEPLKGLEPDKEKKEKFSNGFYRYQYNKHMALEFDSQELSAVKIFSRIKAQQAKKAKEIITIAPINPVKPGKTPNDDDDEPAL